MANSLNWPSLIFIFSKWSQAVDFFLLLPQSATISFTLALPLSLGGSALALVGVAVDLAWVASSAWVAGVVW